MDYFYNQNKNHGYLDQPVHRTGQTLATASLIMGVGALSTCWVFYLSFILGGLGITFAILSQGFERRMIPGGKTGLLLSVTGIGLALLIIFSTAVYLLGNPEIMLNFGREMDQMARQIYGQSAESLNGISYENIVQRIIDFFR